MTSPVDLSSVNPATDAMTLDIIIGANNQLETLFVETISDPGNNGDDSNTAFQFTGLSTLSPGPHTIVGETFNEALVARPNGGMFPLPQFVPSTDTLDKLSYQALTFASGVDQTMYFSIYKVYFTTQGAGLQGDFDNDGDVDGNDFLVWQRDPGSYNLADWQGNYGTGNLTAAVGAVPEPTTALLLSVLGGMALACNRRQRSC